MSKQLSAQLDRGGRSGISVISVKILLLKVRRCDNLKSRSGNVVDAVGKE